MKYRLPVVSGSFYPEEATELKETLASLFAGTKAETAAETPKALIVPHAGYRYSGEIAAAGYASLRGPEMGGIERVLLLGPSHRVGFEGCAIPSHQFFSTPLGDIGVDRQACAQLLEAGLVGVLDQAHQWEHSLEVQLPFLQYLLADFQIVPLVAGHCRPEIIAGILDLFAADAGTRFIISSDLSHYHSDAEARRRDGETIAKILALKPSLQPQDACGCYGINGLLSFCRRHHNKMTLIKSGNSGDVSRDKTRVVGYASFAMV
ncbi:AmmeMemoRadiSam system protein B [Shewanella salipaludis]|uniref:MEMO1 family protein HC757_07350 n=1 Tax=Shewanella salipaludis TaxID=2723052 RepID=A0A972JL27_9GAMM|nr:AmmeMemoRadiSam system protein B [Shewanella salipaludis]NMH64987.1 AmmeMemoRadiSam system protein B [Shewanella salipaludis]